MQDATVNQNAADPSLLVHQTEVRMDGQGPQPAHLCSSEPLPTVQAPVIAGPVSSQAIDFESEHQFQPRINDFGDQTNKTMFQQPHFGQGSYMGHLPGAPQVFSQVWYGYPYQGYIENAVVQHNVFIPPQSRILPDNTLSVDVESSSVDVAESNLVEGAVKQPQDLVSESRSDRSFFNLGTAQESGFHNFPVNPEQQLHLDKPEMVDQKSRAEKVPEKQLCPSVVTKTPEERKFSSDKVDQLTIVTPSVNPPEERPLKAKEESSEDEREVSNMLRGGRSKNFYNQSYGNRRFRNEKFHQPNRGGYQYSRNEDVWRGPRGREDGYPHYRSYRGRWNNRRRPMGDPYRGDPYRSPHE